MRRFIALSLGALVVLASASCRREDTTPEEARDAKRVPVTFTASMDGYQVKGADELSFEKGDAIGLFALEPFNKVNVQADMVDNTRMALLSEVQWALVETAVFVGYYPYTAGLGTTEWTFSVRTDQTARENYRTSDLRGAVATAAFGETVALRFRHLLTKLTVNLTCEDATDEAVSVTLGNVVIEARADLNAAKAVAGTNAADIRAYKTGGNAFAAVFVPQTLTDLPLTVTTKKGQSAVFHLDSPKDFEEGYAYATSLTIPKGAPTNLTFSVTLSDWGDGGSMNFKDGTQTE